MISMVEYYPACRSRPPQAREKNQMGIIKTALVLASVAATQGIQGARPSDRVEIVGVVARDMAKVPWTLAKDVVPERWVNAEVVCLNPTLDCSSADVPQMRAKFGSIIGAKLQGQDVQIDTVTAHQIRYLFSHPIIHSAHTATITVVAYVQVGPRTNLEKHEYSLKRSTAGVWQIVSKKSSGSQPTPAP
jgi:hypothetical protein